MQLDTEKLQIEMARQELNPRDLAKKAGVAASTIYRLMNGKSIPTTKHFGRLSKALGIDVTELLSDTKKEQTH